MAGGGKIKRLDDIGRGTQQEMRFAFWLKYRGGLEDGLRIRCSFFGLHVVSECCCGLVSATFKA